MSPYFFLLNCTGMPRHVQYVKNCFGQCCGFRNFDTDSAFHFNTAPMYRYPDTTFYFDPDPTIWYGSRSFKFHEGNLPKTVFFFFYLIFLVSISARSQTAGICCHLSVPVNFVVLRRVRSDPEHLGTDPQH